MLAIGAVTARSARVWVRVERAGRYALSWSPALGGLARSVSLTVDDPYRDLTGALTVDRGLEPGTQYRVTLNNGAGAPLATGSFVTAPDPAEPPPEHFSVALMSCHQPFDEDGLLAAPGEDMLEATNRVLIEHRVRAVVMGGDQVYSDYPHHASLLDDDYFRTVAPPGCDSVLDCSAAQVRSLFQERYRHFWNVPGWREVLANYPCYPILDDHEVVDNWGSAEVHGTERWRSFRQGAFRAYADYQGSRVRDTQVTPPDDFDYEIELADTATYVMDLRSNRCVGEQAQLISPAQHDAFVAFLSRHAGKAVIFVVLSVPPLHLPRGLVRVAAAVTPDGEDFSDRWSSRGHARDRDRVLATLHDHQRNNPHQRMVLLCGDIHIGCLHRIQWSDGIPDLYQFISSGITHDPGRFIQTVSAAVMRANRRAIVDAGDRPTLTARLRLLRGEAGARRNPCGRLNVGIVETRRSSPTAPPTLRFLLYSHDGPRPRCVYRSPPVEPPGGVA